MNSRQQRYLAKAKALQLKIYSQVENIPVTGGQKLCSRN